MRTELYSERGETSRFVTVEITGDGDLVMMTQDVGKAVEEHWGDSDYEFWVQVKAAHKRQVLEALGGRARSRLSRFFGGENRALLTAITHAYAGNARAVDRFREFLDERGIPNSWDSYV